MYLFEKYNIGALHIPKNAGSTLREHLKIVLDCQWRTVGAEHGLLESKYRLVPENYRIVAVVRNPYDRLASMYYHRKGNYSPKGNAPGWQKLLQNAGTMTFKDWFIKTILPSIGIPEDQPTFRNIQVGGKVPENVSIVKVETLQEDVDKFLAELNIFTDKKIVVKNATAARPSKDWEHLYDDDDELKQLVYKWDKFTFDNYYKEIVEEWIK